MTIEEILRNMKYHVIATFPFASQISLILFLCLQNTSLAAPMPGYEINIEVVELKGNVRVETKVSTLVTM